MKVLNVTTGKYEESRSLIRAVVDVSEQCVEFGYCSKNDPNLVSTVILDDRYGDDSSVYLRKTPKLEEYLIYSNYRGHYILGSTLSARDIIRERNAMGMGDFPYSIQRQYESVYVSHLFKNKQVITSNIEFPLSKYLNYTFGLEFETSMGYIPEDVCIKNGLMPLHDGSISGIEYTTVVLQGNDGLNLLKQEIDVLKKYTFFNKECSLHVHLGGFPVSDKHIFVLHTLCKMLEIELKKYVPRYTFDTAKYKKSGKDYCKSLNSFGTFSELYTYYAEQKYLGSLLQPHPADVRREQKWHVNGRYFWCNFINMLCYKGPKTVEFRLLRPTYNFHKILLWLYIFNAILKFAENFTNSTDSEDPKYLLRKLRTTAPKFINIFYNVYEPFIAEMLLNELDILERVVENQTRNEDYIGRDITLEDMFIDPNKII